MCKVQFPQCPGHIYFIFNLKAFYSIVQYCIFFLSYSYITQVPVLTFTQTHYCRDEQPVTRMGRVRLSSHLVVSDSCTTVSTFWNFHSNKYICKCNKRDSLTRKGSQFCDKFGPCIFWPLLNPLEITFCLGFQINSDFRKNLRGIQTLGSDNICTCQALYKGSLHSAHTTT